MTVDRIYAFLYKLICFTVKLLQVQYCTYTKLSRLKFRFSAFLVLNAAALVTDMGCEFAQKNHLAY